MASAIELDLPPEIIDLEDFTETINILCHADTGGGKTVLWADLPDILILAIEEGTISAKRRLPPPKKGQLRKVWRIKRWPDLVEAYEWLRDHEDHPFKWVMLDSITKAQNMCIRHIMENVVKANPSRDPKIPAQGDHFKWQLTMKDLVSDFNELPVNTVWLARSMVKEDPDGNDIVVPLIEGKDYGISAWVCGEMHLLCYLKKVRKGTGDSARTVRKLYTNEHSMYWCKDRYDALPHVMEFKEPAGVALKIIKMINESGGSREAATETRRKTNTTPPKKRKSAAARTKRRTA